MSTFAAEVVMAAGELLPDYFGQVSSVPKGCFDLVTTADTEVEGFMLAEIRRRFPKHQIIAAG